MKCQFFKAPELANWSRLIKMFLLAVLLFLGWHASQGQKAYRYQVTGRVIDSKGLPVARAYVVVDTGLPTTWEDFTYYVAANDSGEFLFSEPEATTDRNRIRYLYATAPLPQQAFTPIRAPFSRLHGLSEPRFRGRPILIKKNGDSDVGTISNRVWYGIVEFTILDAQGSPLLKKAESWRYVWLRIRNQNRAIVTETGISIADIEQSVSLEKSKINVALPEGIWYVEISPRESKGPWLHSHGALQIKANQSPLQQTLKSRRLH